jgi:hypothetical protein
MSKIKWLLVMMIYTVTNKTCVNLFGATYIVYGYSVRRIK